MGVVVRHPACAMPIHVEAATQHDESSDAWGAWMARAQAGDRAAYHALLQAIGPYLRAIARRILGHEEVEDAAQDLRFTLGAVVIDRRLELALGLAHFRRP